MTPEPDAVLHGPPKQKDSDDAAIGALIDPIIASINQQLVDACWPLPSDEETRKRVMAGFLSLTAHTASISARLLALCGVPNPVPLIERCARAGANSGLRGLEKELKPGRG